jgi:hypothetical protein
MYMNMCILIDMHIYLTKTNQDSLENEPSKSGLINRLLADYYNKRIEVEVDPNVPPGIMYGIPKRNSGKIIKTPKDVGEALKPLVDDRTQVTYLCKNGHISDENGKCLQKGCKHA